MKKSINSLFMLLFVFAVQVFCTGSYSRNGKSPLYSALIGGFRVLLFGGMGAVFKAIKNWAKRNVKNYDSENGEKEKTEENKLK